MGETKLPLKSQVTRIKKEYLEFVSQQTMKCDFVKPHKAFACLKKVSIFYRNISVFGFAFLLCRFHDN